MTIPDIMWTPDGHFHHVVYSLGPYIADYPEQALLACVVQGWCPRYVASDSCCYGRSTVVSDLDGEGLS
jgi:hypothetical protein